ncbi:MAG: hypothetical protein U9R17_06755 [Thermodesulfobacteriota bacterium]|nr:hypothetical protein [Thermodesulfobacteriota bacterium]
MRQTGDWKENEPLTSDVFKNLLIHTINSLDVSQARKEVEPFVRDPETLSIWSKEFFLDIVSRIRFV